MHQLVEGCARHPENLKFGRNDVCNYVTCSLCVHHALFYQHDGGDLPSALLETFRTTKMFKRFDQERRRYETSTTRTPLRDSPPAPAQSQGKWLCCRRARA